MSRVERSVAVEADAARAFAVFCDLDAWWPREYTWTGDERAHLLLTAWPGGRATEIGPGGFRVDWATVVDYAPPRTMTLAWQIASDRVPIPDPEDATRATLRFEDGRVSVEHDFGDDDAYAAGMGAGWEHLLACFARRVNAGAADRAPITPQHVTANVPVSDVEAASAALSGLFALEATMDHGWIRRLDAATGQLQLVIADEHGPAISIGVSDVDDAHERAQALGLDVSYALRDEPWGARRFMFTLPGGSVVNVVGH